MHLLPRMNVMLDFIKTLPVAMEQAKVLKKILPTVGFDPPTPHGLRITSPPLSPLDHHSLDMRLNDMELNVHEIYKYTIYR